jgi:hypothetical protein
MTKKESYTEEEVQKMITEAKINQARTDYGRQWFIESLAHTGSLVNQGAFPAEAHQMGQVFYNQFLRNTEAPPTEDKKPEEEKPDQE